MRKWIALLLAALLVMSLAACSPSTPAENQNTATEPAADAPATDSAAPESTEPEVDFEAGTVENNTYTSSLLGITATLDENWYFLDREEIDQIYGITSEAMDDEEIAKKLEDGSTYADMYATDQSTGATVNVNIQNVGLTALLVSEEAILEAAEGEVIAALESMGLTDVKYELGTMQFAGKEHACVYITGQINGTTLYETQVCVKNGNYVGSITASTVGGDGTGEILGAFEAK